jgi:hypothetical protein
MQRFSRIDLGCEIGVGSVEKQSCVYISTGNWETGRLPGEEWIAQVSAELMTQATAADVHTPRRELDQRLLDLDLSPSLSVFSANVI